MDEQQTLTDRAKAAWHEAQQEERVNDERDNLERTLALVKEGIARVIEATGADPAAIQADHVELGEDGGGVTFYLDDLVLRFTSDAGNQRLDVLRGSCPSCNARLLSGPVYDLIDLGQSLTDGIVHVCPEPEPEWVGDLTFSAGMPSSVDPALILLDALQNYIDGIVRQAVAEQGYRNDDNVIPLTPAWVPPPVARAMTAAPGSFVKAMTDDEMGDF